MSYYIMPEEYDEAKRNGISRNHLHQRVFNLAWDRKRAITQPVRKGNRKYGDLPAIAEKNGIPRGTFYSRVKYGIDPEIAATMKILESKSRRRKEKSE